MMTKIKEWLYNKFLPAYLRESLLEENLRLNERLAQIKAENLRLREYINGMQDALRASRKIIIRNEVAQREHLGGAEKQ